MESLWDSSFVSTHSESEKSAHVSRWRQSTIRNENGGSVEQRRKGVKMVGVRLRTEDVTGQRSEEVDEETLSRF